MDYDGFLSIVERGAAADREEAIRASRETLQTLAERLSKGEAIEIGRQLPEELAPYLWTDRGAEGFDVDEFVRRIAEREGVDIPTAQGHARAVFMALRRVLPPKEYADLTAELSDDYGSLVGPGEVMAAEDFISRVAERAQLDTRPAIKATWAVLEALASRIPAGEVNDLLSRLPVELHPPLKRGQSEGKGSAGKMSAAEFVHRVAEGEGVTDDEAVNHVVAGLAALRQAVGDEEYFDVTVELPPDYEPLLVRA
jgi:uncharacterized protein (DUF2267 family)